MHPVTLFSPCIEGKQFRRGKSEFKEMQWLRSLECPDLGTGCSWQRPWRLFFYLHDSYVIIQWLPKLLVYCFLIRCSSRTLRIRSLLSHLGKSVQKLRIVLRILVLRRGSCGMLKIAWGGGSQDGRAGVSTQTWWLQPLVPHTITFSSQPHHSRTF